MSCKSWDELLGWAQSLAAQISGCCAGFGWARVDEQDFFVQEIVVKYITEQGDSDIGDFELEVWNGYSQPLSKTQLGLHKIHLTKSGCYRATRWYATIFSLLLWDLSSLIFSTEASPRIDSTKTSLTPAKYLRHGSSFFSNQLVHQLPYPSGSVFQRSLSCRSPIKRPLALEMSINSFS